MDCLADTVAIVRHLRQHPALGRNAASILQEADQGLHRIYLSAITLMEVLYLSEAGRIDLRLDELVATIARASNYEVVPVDAEVTLAAVAIDDVPELHDRIIVATARYLGVPILTGDRVIAASQHVQTLW
jgi:PIN domain nuclease of toxin-antitoxin system